MVSKTHEDYYKILQVDPSAEPEVIAAAYRRLAIKYHPDTNKSPDAIGRMQKINEAWEVLSSPVDRAAYDRVRLGFGSNDGVRPHTPTAAYTAAQNDALREAELEHKRAMRSAEESLKQALHTADQDRDRCLHDAEVEWTKAKRTAEEAWKRAKREAEVEHDRAIKDADERWNRARRTVGTGLRRVA